MVAMVLISVPQEAFAFAVYVKNPYSQPLSVATRRLFGYMPLIVKPHLVVRGMLVRLGA